MLDLVPALGRYEGYALALLALWGARGLGRHLREKRSLSKLCDSGAAGVFVPPSLHPLIDPARCIGCGACTHACPEGEVIGLIAGKATLVDPASCIGHGACKAACPVGAIELVLGSPDRGIDIPIVNADGETNVRGLFVAGELGGVGLVANAMEQGGRAIEAIARRTHRKRDTVVDVVIIGAGPAGLAAGLAAKEKALTAVIVEQSRFAGTVAHYPRGKTVMTRPLRVPTHGLLRARRVRKEKLIAFWHTLATRSRLDLRTGVRVERLVPRKWGFDIVTSAGRLSAHAVVLATGRRGSPRPLGVPGEDHPKVAYRLDDAARYRGLRVLVVGGGDSALETALALVRLGDVSVTLCHRGLTFDRAKPASRQRIEDAEARRTVTVMREATVDAIAPDRVVVRTGGRPLAIANDAVIVCAGTELPASLLASAGVAIETKYGTP